MSFPVWNSDPSFNKITSTYFKDLIDLSGNFIIRNGAIKSPANTIEFDDTYSFINIAKSLNVLTQLKNTYNAVEYDVGLQCSKTDILVTDVATISPIVYDTAYKATNFYYDSGANSTVFSNNTSLVNVDFTGNINSFTKTQFDNAINRTNSLTVNCQDTLTTLQGKTTNISFDSGTNTTTIGGLLTLPAGTINSSSINNTSFVDLTNGQTINGIKRFTANVRMDSALLVNAGATSISNTVLGYISTLSSNCQTQLSGLNNRITAVETKTTPITYTALTTTTLITGIIQWTGTLNGWSTTNFSNAINYAKDATSPLQTQINNINAVTLAANNTFTGNQTFNGTTTTVANTLSSSTFTFSTSINGTTKAIFDNILLYCNSLSGNVQTAITTANTNISTLTTKLTDISFASSTTTIANTLASSTLTFSTTINGATKTVFDNVMLYCNTLSGNVQTALTNLSYSVNPVATIIMSPMSDIQTTSSNKYLLCDGQSVGRSSFPNLFAKIGTTFGSADPFSFNVPNYQGVFLRGYGQSMINGQIYEGNFTVNSPQQDAIQYHNHFGQQGSYCGTNRVSGVTNAFASGGFFPGTYNFDQTGLQSTGRNDSGETRPVNFSVYYYIKS